MAKRGCSFETYRKRSIKHAVKKLDPKAAKQLIRAFEATHCMDLYGGELETYLAVIADRLEAANKKIEKLDGIIFDFKKKVAEL